MALNVEYIVRTAPLLLKGYETPLLLNSGELISGEYMRVGGKLKKPIYSQCLKNGCEIWYLELKKIPGFMFQANIPSSEVKFIDWLSNEAEDVDVILEARLDSRRNDEERVFNYITTWLYAGGHEMPLKKEKKRLNKKSNSTKGNISH